MYSSHVRCFAFAVKAICLTREAYNEPVLVLALAQSNPQALIRL